MEEKKVAVISVIMENTECADQVNEVFRTYADYVIGRMGIPYHERGISIITAVVDADQEIINGITGKLGMIKCVNAKALIRSI